MRAERKPAGGTVGHQATESAAGSRRAAGSLESAVLGVLWQAKEPLSPGEVRERLTRTDGTAGGTKGGRATGGSRNAAEHTTGHATADATAKRADRTTADATGTTAGGESAELSYSTVVTILTRLHDKGTLSRERDGRAFRYAPVADEAGLAARRLTQLLDRAPDREAVLSRFVEDLSEHDERLLRELLGGRADGGGAK